MGPIDKTGLAVAREANSRPLNPLQRRFMILLAGGGLAVVLGSALLVLVPMMLKPEAVAPEDPGVVSATAPVGDSGEGASAAKPVVDSRPRWLPGDSKEALAERLEASWREGKSSPEERLALGVLLQELGRPRTAAEVLATVEPESLTDVLRVERLAALGRQALIEGRSLDAVELVREMLALPARGGRNGLWLLQAVVQDRFTHGDLAAAEDLLRSVTPSDPHSLLVLAVRVHLTSGNLDRAQAVVEKTPQAFAPAERHQLLAEIAHSRGDGEAARREWSKGWELAIAEGELTQMRRLAALAIAWGDDLRLGKVIRESRPSFAALEIPGNLWMMGLMALLKDGVSEEALAVADHLAASAPAGSPLVHNRAYLRLLASQADEPTAKAALDIAQATAGDPRTAATAILATRYLGDAAREQALFASIPRDQWSAAPPASRVIAAGSLLASGSRPEAYALVADINRSELLPEERALLDAVLGR